MRLLPPVATFARSITRSWTPPESPPSKFTVHDLSYVALDGMMKSVNDRYTVFLSPKDFAGLNQGLDGGDFGGTGIVIQVDDKTKYISVENVVPDAPCRIRRASSRTTSSQPSTALPPKA